MIEKLTAEQTAQIAIYRDKWIDVGLSCEPMNFEAAKSAMIKAYSWQIFQHQLNSMLLLLQLLRLN